MKIKAEYIGTEIRMNGKRWYISPGNESEYKEAGLNFIFEAKSPKIKRNAKNTEESTEHIDCDSDGTPDSGSSDLAV
jgi:hypothetical protein